MDKITGFNQEKLQDFIDRKVTFKTFFEEANLNPKGNLIKGIICGYRIVNFIWEPKSNIKKIQMVIFNVRWKGYLKQF